jgi:hypothetical protein
LPPRLPPQIDALAAQSMQGGPPGDPEFEPQSRLEGEIQHMPADFPVTEFWRVLSGQQAGRSHAGQVTIFDSVGFALEALFGAHLRA